MYYNSCIPFQAFGTYSFVRANDVQSTGSQRLSIRTFLIGVQHIQLSCYLPVRICKNRILNRRIWLQNKKNTTTVHIKNLYQQVLDDRRGARFVLRRWTIMYIPCKLQCPWSSASDPAQSRWTDRAASLLVFWTPVRTPRSCPAPLCKLGWNRLQYTQGKISHHLQRHRCNKPWI